MRTNIYNRSADDTSAAGLFIRVAVLAAVFVFHSLLFVSTAGAQSHSTLLPPPDTTNVERYDDLRLQPLIGSTATVPFFSQDGTRFWYSWHEAGQQPEYRVYDVKRGRSVISSPDEFERRRYPKINPYGTSPDSVYRLSADSACNLWIEHLPTGRRHQLTTDGEQGLAFDLVDVQWLAGGYYLVPRKDSRLVRHFALTYYTVMPPMSYSYPYELPGDSHVERQDYYLGHTGRHTLSHVADAHHWPGEQLTLQRAPGVSDRVYFWRRKRTRDEAELCTVDTAGIVRMLIHEAVSPRLNPDMQACHVVDGGCHILLWSDRSGWGHYYHYDADGRLLGAVTQGQWTAERILSIDTLRQRLVLTGYGREPGRNPYYAHAYAVDFSGRHLRLLTPEDAHHNVFVGPGQRLLVDIYSRINVPPVVCVRNGAGRRLATLEQTDISRLTDYGWRPAEPFTVTAADGQTPLYGLMWKPYDFDSTRTYPIISQVYPGPFIETVWPDFTVFDKYHNGALAQRGFIVVVTGHRGSSPLRSRDYNTYGYGNLRDYALDDDVSCLRQLWRRHSYIDSTRVGIFGHSGGAAMAFAALCTYPEVYRCAVCSSGNHDNHIYNRTWGENYQGITDSLHFTVKTSQQLAPRLQGPVLLVTGDADQNVHPAHTLRLADALIRANKDFELLVLPGQGHHYAAPYEQYFERRKRDFFDRHLK